MPKNPNITPKAVQIWYQEEGMCKIQVQWFRERMKMCLEAREVQLKKRRTLAWRRWWYMPGTKRWLTGCPSHLGLWKDVRAYDLHMISVSRTHLIKHKTILAYWSRIEKWYWRSDDTAESHPEKLKPGSDWYQTAEKGEIKSLLYLTSKMISYLNAKLAKNENMPCPTPRAA